MSRRRSSSSAWTSSHRIHCERRPVVPTRTRAKASMNREPIALSWSGGKDSTLALAALRADPRHEVVALLTSVTSGYDRISIHGVRRTLLEAQVAALGLPLF